MNSAAASQQNKGHEAIDTLLQHKIARNFGQREMVRRYIDRRGDRRICGGKDLKRSQAYPKGLPVLDS